MHEQVLADLFSRGDVACRGRLLGRIVAVRRPTDLPHPRMTHCGDAHGVS